MLNHYHYSLTTAKNSRIGVEAQLNRGYFVYNPPAGLSRQKIGEKQLILRQDEKMPLIRRAFEMKAEGISHKEISKFLRVN